jgi:hypothetical protein
MPRVHGSKAVLWIDDQGGTCRNLSGDFNSITFNRSKNEPETTTFGDTSVQREILGLRDASIDVTAIFSSGSLTEPAGLLDEMYAGSLHSRIQYLPAGSITGSPIYTASMRLTSLAVNQPVDNLVTANFSLALAAGSVTQACIT